MHLIKTVFLRAPREHVWRFLVEADRLALWFHRGEQDVRASGPWALVSNSMGQEGTRILWGEVLVYEPPSRLVHTLTVARFGGVETTCSWTLQSVDGGTLLTLTHEGLDQLGPLAPAAAGELDPGWDEHFARLRRVTA